MVHPSEPEFEQVSFVGACFSSSELMSYLLQALNELTSTLQPFLKANPEYQRALDVVQVPERVIQFRVVWEDDHGVPHVQRGFRVQVRVCYISPVCRVRSYLCSTTPPWDHTRVASAFTPPSTSASSSSLDLNRHSRTH